MTGPVRTRIASSVAVAVVGLGASLAGAAPSATTLKVSQSSALDSSIVVGPTGLTLYHLVSEQKGAVACFGACAKQWPPLTIPPGAKVVAGPGLAKLKLSTMKRPDGGIQVTYGGFGLYRFAGDKKAGQVNGQGVGSAWYAVTPAGKITRAAASTTTVAPSSPSTGATAPSSPSTTAPSTTVPTGTTPSMSDY